MTRPKKLSAAGVSGARRAPLADWIPPALCTLVEQAPAGDDWLHEIKLDGYRIVARVDGGHVQLLSRNRKDWTSRFSAVAHALEKFPVRRAMLDGEVAIVLPDGTTSFQALQNALSRDSDQNTTYFVFDLMHLDDYDLTGVALVERKRLLAALLDGASHGRSVLRYSDHVRGHGPDLYRQACGRSLEGIIAKRCDETYHSGRSKCWLKVKCLQEQEFVIGGYTKGEGSRTGFGALLLGVHEAARELRYAGKVGTGFSEQSLRELSARLARLQRRDATFADAPASVRRSAHWVKPELVAQVAFVGWTRDGRLRHPSFRGLRADRPAREVVRELPAPLPAGAGAAPASPGKTTSGSAQPALSPRATTAHTSAGNLARHAGVRITNPEKVLYPQPGVTKRELADYYEMVAPWMLPTLAQRPLTLVRCPDGYEGECFFQKSAEGMSPRIGRVSIPSRSGQQPATFAFVHDAAGLMSLVQMGVLEFHVWGSQVEHLETPDRIVFDLDPGPGVTWTGVVEAAEVVRTSLSKLHLLSLVLLTGGKGLHVVVPILPEYDWEIVKEFSHAVVQTIVRDHPSRYTARLAKRRRDRKIFIDYLRNGRGATAVAPYSTRARAGAPVAVPVGWEELSEELQPDSFNVRNLRARIEQLREDPWQRSGLEKQSLRSILEGGELQRAAGHVISRRAG